MINEIKECGNSGTIFCTHYQALLTDHFPFHETIVIDESCEQVMLNIHTLCANELKELLQALNEPSDLLNCTENDYYTTPITLNDDKAIQQICVEKRFKTKVGIFFPSQYFTRKGDKFTITVNNTEKLNSKKKYIYSWMAQHQIQSTGTCLKDVRFTSLLIPPY